MRHDRPRSLGRGAGYHLAELLGSGQSVEAGHPDVEQGDVRPVPEREFDGLASVSGLGDRIQGDSSRPRLEAATPTGVPPPCTP